MHKSRLKLRFGFVHFAVPGGLRETEPYLVLFLLEYFFTSRNMVAVSWVTPEGGDARTTADARGQHIVSFLPGTLLQQALPRLGWYVGPGGAQVVLANLQDWLVGLCVWDVAAFQQLPARMKTSCICLDVATIARLVTAMETHGAPLDGGRPEHVVVARLHDWLRAASPTVCT